MSLDGIPDGVVVFLSTISHAGSVRPLLGHWKRHAHRQSNGNRNEENTVFGDVERAGTSSARMGRCLIRSRRSIRHSPWSWASSAREHDDNILFEMRSRPTARLRIRTSPTCSSMTSDSHDYGSVAATWHNHGTSRWRLPHVRYVEPHRATGSIVGVLVPGRKRVVGMGRYPTPTRDCSRWGLPSTTGSYSVYAVVFTETGLPSGAAWAPS